MRTHNTQQYARSEYHTQLAKMSFDEIFDLTAGGVFLYFFINIDYYVSKERLRSGDPHLAAQGAAG